MKKRVEPNRLTFPILFKFSTSEKTCAPQNFKSWLSWSVVEEKKKPFNKVIFCAARLALASVRLKTQENPTCSAGYLGN